MSEFDIVVEFMRTPGNEDLPLPKYETTGAAGMDITAAVTEPVVIKPGERKLIPAGFRMAIPFGYECQVRSRSGLALKKGIVVANAPGTIDSDYRGDVGVILANISNENFTVARGDRIAQMVFAAVMVTALDTVDKLSETERGAGGFGSTGV